MQFILKVHQLLFSEDLGKSINSSTCMRIHMAFRNFSALSRTGDTETVLSALNDVASSIDCCNW